jgi:hypothetical protein
VFEEQSVTAVRILSFHFIFDCLENLS